jgi:predicted ATPase
VDHPFKKILENFIENGISLTMIHLDCTNKEKLQKLVSTLLHLSPRSVKGLSDIIYHKTKGNPLFVSRLLLSMNRDGLLSLSLSRRRWVWDESLIKSIELPTDVATFFSRVISRLSPEVQSALQVLSCFGSAESCELLILEAKLVLELVKPLDLAVDEGFVSKNDDKYRFSHDQIQEAAYIMVPLEYRWLEHLEYGLCLVEVSVEKENDCLLFTALGQINLAGPSVVTDVMLSTEIAQHNLVAGKKAIAMSEFSCAARFLNSGILFLKKNHWRDHYRLSLELFGLAAKCSLIVGDFTCLAAMSEEIEKHAQCLDDKLDNLFVVMSSYANGSKISDSIQLGLSILNQLGCELPTTSTKTSTMSLIKRTQENLSTLPDSVLLNYKQMTDSRHIMAMKCLAKLEFPTLQVSPELQPIVNLKMVEMTINHGMCDSSPVGFAYFASMLTKCGEMRDGYRFAKLAKTLLHQVGSKETLGDDFDCFESGCLH